METKRVTKALVSVHGRGGLRRSTVSHPTKPSSSKEGSMERDHVHIHADFSLFEVDIRAGGCSDQGLQWSRQLVNSRKEKYFAESMLLKSLEREATFPSIGIIFWDLCSVHPLLLKSRPFYNKSEVIEETSQSTSSRRDTEFRHCDIYTHGCYEEEGSIGKDGISALPKRPINPNSIYYIMCFKTQGNGVGLTNTWRTWTGADFILWRCPQVLNLQRVSFYKHVKPDSDDIMFILLIECSEGLAHQQAAFHFLERLRDRRCGHVGAYYLHT